MSIGRKSPNKPRGSILVTLLLMMSILAIMVATVAKDSMQNMRSVAQSGRDTQAKYAAYAGLELALNELRKDPQYVGEELRDRHGEVIGNLEDLENLRYEVLMWNNIPEEDEEISDLEDLEGPDDVQVKPDTVYIISSGRDMERGEGVILTSMAGTATRIRPVFDDAAYARTKMALSGPNAKVDAWDSSGGWGGYEAYNSGGDSSGSGSSGSGSGDSGGPGSSGNVQDYKATLGTDSAGGRTLRLIEGAELNGHFRVGPRVDPDRAFGSDAGSSSAGPRGTEIEHSYDVTTTDDPSLIMGIEPDTPGAGTGPPAPSEDKVLVDTKDTEVPHFVAPIAETDVAPAPTVNNPSTEYENEDGDTVVEPPAPYDLPQGGYESIEVPAGQTLRLSPGVYYFRDEFAVTGGKVTTVGDGPVIIFCGKKARLHNAEINTDRSSARLQMCFTDEIKDEVELNAIAAQVEDIFDGTPGDLDNYKNMISPLLGDTGERRGFSVLEMTGDTKIQGSVSGRGLVTNAAGGEIFGSIMGNVVKGRNLKIHQDLALKGSNLMVAGGWKLEGVHQLR